MKVWCNLENPPHGYGCTGHRRALCRYWLALLFPLCIAATDSSNLPAEWRHARTLYYQAVDGDNTAYRSAEKLFPELYATHRQSPVVQVYYGSLRLLEAGRTWAVWRKNRLSTEGIQLMDRAVSAQPQDLEIRFVRAVTTYHLPEFFNRKEQSKTDFAYLARFATKAARTGELEPRLAAASLYFHGNFLDEAGHESQAIATWKNAIAIAPESPAAQGAREKLLKAQP